MGRKQKNRVDAAEDYAAAEECDAKTSVAFVGETVTPEEFSEACATANVPLAGDPETPEASALAEIAKAREAVRKSEVAYITQKERAKEAKAEWEGSVANLTTTIDRLTRPLPLFDGRDGTAHATGAKERGSDEARGLPGGSPVSRAADEKRVKLASRLYEARDAARGILGDKYDEMMRVWADHIRQRMKRDGTDILPTCMALAKEEVDEPRRQMWVLAAAVEMIEPSVSPVANGNADWRKLPVKELGISAATMERLINADLGTLGGLSAAMKANPGGWWNGVRGIGESTAADIADRLGDFFRKHPEYTK